MTEQTVPDIGRSLVLVHQVITRGLQVSIENCATFASQSFPDSQTRQGFLDYVSSLLTFLEGHHLLEDELAFPAMRPRLPEAPYDLLMEQHQQIESLLELARQSLAQIAAEADGEDFEALAKHLTQIQSLWPRHIQMEEMHLNSQALLENFSPVELIEMAGKIGAFNQQHSQPPELVIPFTLYNLTPAERAHLAAGMPPVIIQELVPLVWKERWAPMQPFLFS